MTINEAATEIAECLTKMQTLESEAAELENQARSKRGAITVATKRVDVLTKFVAAAKNIEA